MADFTELERRARFVNSEDPRMPMSMYSQDVLDLLSSARADGARLDWLIAHLTEIDWFALQNGDGLRAIIDERRALAIRRAPNSEVNNG